MISTRVFIKYSSQRHLASFIDKRVICDNGNLRIGVDDKDMFEYSLKSADVKVDYYSNSFSIHNNIPPPTLVITCYGPHPSATSSPSMDIYEIVLHLSSVADRDRWLDLLTMEIERHRAVSRASAESCMQSCVLELKKLSLQSQVETHANL